ncbi:MFS transporter [Novosphingobium sp. FKTRR1]|uniref:MFS transporter n=1 Tax=Novosphingobium sp. FKTRR1 TaxID=2879118 RepID=UPI001CF069FA|nr:MFS transporter [Novosphingobium sp. FKTRR1]
MNAAEQPPARWSAVLALTLCVSTLIASEFMPVSLLTPIAADLRLSAGEVGQAISISGLFAVITSLVVARISALADRRHLLLGLTLLMLVSGLMVAGARNYAMLMLGRALVGVVIGGFWSMSAATVMRLVPAQDVPRALAVLNGGNALATTIAAPLGSFIGQFVGWRWAFFLVVPLAALTFAWQWLTLPPMRPAGQRPPANSLALLARPAVRKGMAAVFLMFAGQFAVFTYFRPFLEQRAHLSVSLLSLVLLGMGLAGVLGNILIGRLVRYSLDAALTAPSLALAAIAVLLVVSGTNPLAAGGLLLLWGFVGTPAPVAWWTWLARTLPDDAETGGGLMVAVVQLAITLGAGGGGILFDALGYGACFLAGGALLASAALLGAAGASGTAPVRRASRR